jgi:hypothetical protein
MSFEYNYVGWSFSKGEVIVTQISLHRFALYQGCIFWPLSPPQGGGEIGTFGSLGKKIDPREKIKFNCKEKI